MSLGGLLQKFQKAHKLSYQLKHFEDKLFKLLSVTKPKLKEVSYPLEVFKCSFW